MIRYIFSILFHHEAADTVAFGEDMSPALTVLAERSLLRRSKDQEAVMGQTIKRSGPFKTRVLHPLRHTDFPAPV